MSFEPVAAGFDDFPQLPEFTCDMEVAGELATHEVESFEHKKKSKANFLAFTRDISLALLRLAHIKSHLKREDGSFAKTNLDSMEEETLKFLFESLDNKINYLNDQYATDHTPEGHMKKIYLTSPLEDAKGHLKVLVEKTDHPFLRENAYKRLLKSLCLGSPYIYMLEYFK